MHLGRPTRPTGPTRLPSSGSLRTVPNTLGLGMWYRHSPHIRVIKSLVSSIGAVLRNNHGLTTLDLNPMHHHGPSVQAGSCTRLHTPYVLCMSATSAADCNVICNVLAPVPAHLRGMWCCIAPPVEIVARHAAIAPDKHPPPPCAWRSLVCRVVVRPCAVAFAFCPFGVGAWWVFLVFDLAWVVLGVSANAPWRLCVVGVCPWSRS